MSANVDIGYGGMLPARTITLEWTAASDGSFDGFLTQPLRGMLLRVVFVPGSGGDQPDDNYDLTLEDESGLDVLRAQGVNLDEATTTHVCPGVRMTEGTYTSLIPVMIDGTLELHGSGCGDSNKGTVVLYID